MIELTTERRQKSRILENTFLPPKPLTVSFSGVDFKGNIGNTKKKRAGMSKNVISVKLPEDIYERLSRLAQETGRTKSFYIRLMLEEHLDELEDVYLAEETMERVRASRERVYTLAEAESFLSHRHSTRAFSLKN